MNFSDFYVGQEILYKDTWRPDLVHSRVLRINLEIENVTFLWNTKGPHGGVQITLRLTKTFNKMTPVVVLSIEEQVNNRIKHLWNTSNYVKNNSHLSY